MNRTLGRKSVRTARLLFIVGLVAAGFAIHSGLAVRPAFASSGNEAQLPEEIGLAPEDTLAAVVLDLQALTEAPIIQRLEQQMRMMMPPTDPTRPQAREQVERAVLFVSGTLEEPSVAALVKLMPGARAVIEEEIAAEAEEVTIEGLKAYKASPETVSPGLPLADAEDREMLAAFADDLTLLFAASQEALQTLITNHGRGSGAGLGADLQSILDIHAGDGLNLAFTLPEDLISAVPEEDREEVPEMIRSMKAAALGVSADEQLRMRASLRMGSTAEAQTLVQEAQSLLDEQKQQLQTQMQASPQMAGMLQPIVEVMDRVSISTSEADARFSITLTDQDLMALPMLMMQMTMMQGGDMPGGPPPGAFPAP